MPFPKRFSSTTNQEAEKILSAGVFLTPLSGRGVGFLLCYAGLYSLHYSFIIARISSYYQFHHNVMSLSLYLWRLFGGFVKPEELVNK